MRRLVLAIVLACAAAPLAAQEAAPEGAEPAPGRNGWAFGVVGMTGGPWNPTAFEVALVRGLGTARARNVMAGLRFGGWTAETGIVTGTRGWFLGLTTGLRHNLITLLEVGASESSIDYALLTGTLEVTANVDHRSPTPDNAHLTAGYLFGLSYSDGATVDEAFAVQIGPVAYIGGDYVDWRLQVGLRFQSPFTRR